MTEGTPTAAPAPPSPAAPPSSHKGLWLGTLLVIAGGAWLLSALGVVELSAQVGIGLLLVGIGGVIALDAGHSHGLLVALAVVLSLVGAAATWVDTDLLDGGIGERIEAPVAQPDIAGGYNLGIGKLTVDLTGLQPTADGSPVPVAADVGIGQLVVVVSQDADVEVDAHVAMGNINTVGTNKGGFDVEERSQLAGTGTRIALDANVGIGEVQVIRGG